MAEHARFRTNQPFSLVSFLSVISKDVFFRFNTIISFIITLAFIPIIRADDAASGTEPPNSAFTARTSNDPKVLADVKSMVTPFNFEAWKTRGEQIRSGSNRAECFGNLSLALSEIGNLYQAGSAGASGALSLLPTAGALIGAPAKELWILFKLVPVAGFLSMLLSLGGNIVPQELGDYTKDSFSYGGMIATDGKDAETYEQPLDINSLSPESFANAVRKRALNSHGSSKIFVAVIGIISQLLWIAVIMVACYITSAGGIVAWWCKAWGWMFLWYLMVALSSLLENFAAAPFTKQWTVRVSKAPETVVISNDAPVVAGTMHATDVEGQRANNATKSGPQIFEMVQLNGNSDDEIEQADTVSQQDVRPLQRRTINLREVLNGRGINTTGKIIMSRDEAWCASRHSFYVIISVAKIGHGHATLRVISKAISVGVFAAGTATFASATLITISIALTTLCLILGAGVLGRVASLWMASKFLQERPILQRTVKSVEEANSFMTSMLGIPGLTFELEGHVFLNGCCIHRYSQLLRWSTLFGILAPPFRVDKLAT